MEACDSRDFPFLAHMAQRAPCEFMPSLGMHHCLKWGKNVQKDKIY